MPNLTASELIDLSDIKKVADRISSYSRSDSLTGMTAEQINMYLGEMFKPLQTPSGGRRTKIKKRKRRRIRSRNKMNLRRNHGDQTQNKQNIKSNLNKNKIANKNKRRKRRQKRSKLRKKIIV